MSEFIDGQAVKIEIDKLIEYLGSRDLTEGESKVILRAALDRIIASQILIAVIKQRSDQ